MSVGEFSFYNRFNSLALAVSRSKEELGSSSESSSPDVSRNLMSRFCVLIKLALLRRIRASVCYAWRSLGRRVFA